MKYVPFLAVMLFLTGTCNPIEIPDLYTESADTCCNVDIESLSWQDVNEGLEKLAMDAAADVQHYGPDIMEAITALRQLPQAEQTKLASQMSEDIKRFGFSLSCCVFLPFGQAQEIFKQILSHTPPDQSSSPKMKYVKAVCDLLDSISHTTTTLQHFAELDLAWFEYIKAVNDKK